MPDRIRQKWRPPLALVIGGTLTVVLCLPLIGIAHFRVAGNILGWGETAWMIFWMVVAATTILGFLLWRLVLRPVYALTAHALAVKEGRTDAPLPPHFGTPEITALGQAVLDMGTTLKDRESGLRAYTNHVTHELKSPLTTLIGATELLSDNTSPKDREDLTKTIRNAALTLQDQLEALRRLSAARDPVGPGPAQLSEVAREVEIETELPIQLDGDLLLPMDARALAAVLGHLAHNAKAHGADRLFITATQQRIAIRDNGTGIAPGNRGRIFNPFFTTRREKGGTGMGLSIVRTMLEAAGGGIELIETNNGADDGADNGADNGAAFSITFSSQIANNSQLH